MQNAKAKQMNGKYYIIAGGRHAMPEFRLGCHFLYVDETQICEYCTLMHLSVVQTGHAVPI